MILAASHEHLVPRFSAPIIAWRLLLMAAAGGDEETKSGLTGDTMMTGAGGGGPDGPRAFGDSAIDAPSRELARITRRYTGHGLVQRLRFAARAVPATAKRQAYEQLLQVIQQTTLSASQYRVRGGWW